MIENVLPGLYRVEIPLYGNPLRAVNSYFIRGSERCLIIDTGLNREECKQAMQASLKELDVDISRTDFFITHVHVDHIGLLGELVKDGTKVYCNIAKSESADFRKIWETATEYFSLNGLPDIEIQKATESHPGRKYRSSRIPTFTGIDDGDTIAVGDYSFRCIETSGHSPGHTCLYEAERKILIAGDHILLDITPNVMVFNDQTNPLKDYLNNLEKLYSLDIKLVLPGHGHIFSDHKRRINEIKQHHVDRANEVLNILKDGAKNAYQVASRLKWDLPIASWDEFPSTHKWFATGEALAHLKYLEYEGRVKREKQAGIFVFSGV